MTRTFKIFFIAGARPNFMKIAPIIKAIDSASVSYSSNGITLLTKIIHTGQHYDHNMSDVFFQELGIPRPHWNLEVGSGSHAQQTARIMIEFEKVLDTEMPDLLIVVGDVNSTIACSLTAKKMGIPVAHVEAGLRSFDMDMPEEINRKLTDAISDYLFVTEESGVNNLTREGVEGKKIFFVGNVMIDTLLVNLKRLKNGLWQPSQEILKWVEENQRYAVLTLHRPSNVDTQDVFTGIWSSIIQINADLPVLFPVHPRTAQKMKFFNLKGDGVTLVEPLGYMDMLYLVSNATLVLTDSGGLQEETTVLEVPCITIRENTERPSTVDVGTNYLVGTDAEKILEMARLVIKGQGKKGTIPPLWDGKAAERITLTLFDIFKKS